MFAAVCATHASLYRCACRFLRCRSRSPREADKAMSAGRLLFMLSSKIQRTPIIRLLRAIGHVTDARQPNSPQYCIELLGLWTEALVEIKRIMSGSSKATSLKAASRTAEASPPAASGAPTGSDGLTKRAGWHVPRSRAVDPSPAALLKEGTQAKERGNHLFRKNEHRAAIRLYKQAILSTRGLYSRTCAMSIYS